MTDRPMAAAQFKSYRYRGRYGWIMIGAMDDDEALREAQRSTDDPVTRENLQRWSNMWLTRDKSCRMFRSSTRRYGNEAHSSSVSL